MHTTLIEWLAQNYHWGLSLLALVSIAATSFIGGRLLMLVPTFKEAAVLNTETYQNKMKRPEYAANQRWNRKWGLLDQVVIFGVILPFCLTLEPQPWWRILRDTAVILMFYDFLYYLVHRFLFHGPALLRVHAIHHRQHNPCRMDSSYIHPVEVAIGLALYAGSILVLSRLMGDFHVVTIVVTFIAFTQINLHNHDLWTADRFPFRYLSYVAKMHHNHHAKFTGGNFATITLLYDWMFGTLDLGDTRGERGVAAAE